MSVASELGRAVRQAFGRSFQVAAGLALASGLACWAVEGRSVLIESLLDSLGLIAVILPKVVAALVFASLVKALVPFSVVSRWVGEESGARGIAIAAGAGAATPGGPVTSFPLVRALRDAGAGTRPLIAYITSWSLLGLQRIVVWEIPLVGLEFALIRLIASLPLPFVAVLMSRLVPIAPEPARPEE